MSLAISLVVDNIYRVITMRNAIRFLLIVVVLCASALVLSKPGGAAIGRSADSVEADRTALSGVGGAVTVGNGYSVHQINYGGTAAREYVSSDGTVFAVAWNGTRHPDLSVLLGAYAGSYKEVLRGTTRQPGVRHLSLKADGVVVQKWGHVRNLRGRDTSRP